MPPYQSATLCAALVVIPSTSRLPIHLLQNPLHNVFGRRWLLLFRAIKYINSI